MFGTASPGSQRDRRHPGPHPTGGGGGMRLIDLSGRRFGRLTVTGRMPSNGKKTMWACACSCGAGVTVRGAHLTAGLIRSCNCLNTDAKRQRQTKHGDAPFGQPHTDEYRTWQHIKSRCLNPNVRGYEHYGGRGIAVCDAWLDDYAAFLRDMGRRPSAKHSIERLNNDGNYEPGNCVWATAIVQNRNRRCVKMTLGKAESARQLFGRGMSFSAIGRELDIPYHSARNAALGNTWLSNAS